MLTLLQSPHWRTAGVPPQRVPATVPGALLLHLAALGDGQGAWVERERVLALFWPDRSAADAQRNLRVNLHRLRELLVVWGCGSALQAERTQLQLALPTDLAGLATALASGEPAALLASQPQAWLQGYRLAGFDGFREWADAQHQRWQQAWLAAVEPALLRALMAPQQSSECRQALDALLAAWVAAADGQDMPALRAIDAQGLSAEARVTWQQLCARLPPWAAAVSMARSAQARPLAGRTVEQDALRASAAAATVLLGEPGVGKTTLLVSCWPEAPMLRAREGLAGAPFAPVLEWLRHHAARWRQALAEHGSGPHALAPYRLDLARLLPELAPDEALPPLDAHTAKARLLEALCRLFEREGPLLLVDDLQWCDIATLEWLVFAAHRGRQRWRASARRHELTGAVRQSLDSLRAAHLLVEQELPALCVAALGEACRQRWPHRFANAPQAVLEGLHQACDGNPFVLGELVAAGADHQLARGAPPALPPGARDLVQRRLQALAAAPRALVEAAAVLGRPASLDLLQRVVHGTASTTIDPWPACEQALAAELLVDGAQGLQCRHDLVRHAVTAGLGAARLQWLHRCAALALGAQPTPEPLAVATHWQAAQEPQTALPWLHHGAAQQKLRGRFDEARALWQQVADDSLDPTLALRARLALANSQFFHNLAEGCAALHQVLGQLGAVADLQQRHALEAEALAGLIDNAVFSGQVPRAAQLAPRLRELLPQLPTEQRAQALEVLIELAMREPDIDGARALLQQLQRLAPRSPSTRSFEAQVHWFGGDARAARDAFEALLASHPDYCRGLTIENDLAVMHNALGELHRAEDLARRSLASWQGVAHTECLSLLVLGSVLTSAGRHDEASATLDQALALAQAQASGLFEAEALSRRARLWLHCGRWTQAQADLDAVQPLLRESTDPLRVSQYAMLRSACQAALGQAVDTTLADRLRDISLRSVHPLLHARMARLHVLAALQASDSPGALAAARRQADIARSAGVLEPLCDALLLQARAHLLAERADLAVPLWREAATLADAQGFADLAWRAHAGLASRERGRTHQAAERRARKRLLGDVKPALFQPEAAALLEPRLPPQG